MLVSPFSSKRQQTQALSDDGVNRFQAWESKLKIPIPLPWASKKAQCACACACFPSLKAQEYLKNQAVSPWRCEPVGDSWSRATQASRTPHSMGRFQTPRRPPSLTFPKVLRACFSCWGGGGTLLSSADVSSNEDNVLSSLKGYKGLRFHCPQGERRVTVARRGT